MEEKYEAAKKILEKYNQEQLLSNYDKLTDDKKVEESVKEENLNDEKKSDFNVYDDENDSIV